VEENPAEVVAGLLVDAAAAGGNVVLTGGSTPKLAYEIASRAGADWSRATIWFSDERCVEPESGLSRRFAPRARDDAGSLRESHA